MKPRASSQRQVIFRLAGTLLAIILLVVLVRQGGWADIVAAVKRISLPSLLLALAFVLCSRLFVIARWYILLRSGGVPISLRDTISLTFTGLFSANFLPTTVGGDAVRLVGAMQMGFDRAVCLASIAADRLIGMLGMFTAVPLGLIPAIHSLQPNQAYQSIAVAPALNRLWEFLRRTLQTFSIWLRRPAALLGAFAFTWGHMLCTFAALYVLIRAMGGYVPLWMIAGLWSLAYFVTLVPISINGYGVQELSLTFLFSNVAGLSTSMSLTAAVLMRALYLLASLVGAIYLPGILAAMDPRRAADNESTESQP